MRVFRSYIYRLYPNKRQKEQFLKFHTQYCNFFNALVSDKSSFAKSFNLNDFLKQNPEYKTYNQNLILNVYKIFNKLKYSLQSPNLIKPKNSAHYPKKIRFSISENNQPIVFKNHISFPGFGNFKIKLHRPLPNYFFCMNVILEERLKDKFYINLGLAISKKVNYQKPIRSIGLDYSSPNFYHTNENELGKEYIVRNFNEAKISKIRRKMSRCVFNSKNYIKYRDKLESLSQQVSNKRNYMLHRAANYILSKYDLIGIETLSLTSIASYHHLGKHTYENAFSKFCLILKYKAEELGKYVENIPKYYPSSQLCSKCGIIHKDLSLDDRIIKCECGNIINRDLNAAINIKNKAIEQYELKYKEKSLNNMKTKLP